MEPDAIHSIAILCAARYEPFRLSAMVVPPPPSTPDYTPGTDGLSVPSV